MFVRKLEATKLVTSSDSARLECKVKGSPVISFKWFKNEMEISSSPKYKMEVTDLVASLEILKCTVEDSGDYVCVASSEAGSDRCSSTVTVKGWCSLKHYLSFSVIYFRIEPYCDTEDILLFCCSNNKSAFILSKCP